MSAIDYVGRGEFEALKQEMRALQTQSPLESSSVSGGRVRFIGGLLRVDSGGSVQIVGTLEIDGLTTVTGTFNVNGPWNLAGNGVISGNATGTGTLTWNGPWTLNGAGAIAGNVTSTGTWTQNGPWNFNGNGNVQGDVSVTGGGRLLAGAVTITPSGGGKVQVSSLAIDGADGGTIRSGGTIYMVGGGGPSVRVVGTLTASDLLVLGDITAGTLDVVGSKNFRMPHPLKPGHWLRHGSTESPVSGTEYTGKSTIGLNGSVDVELPVYFETLNKAGNRTVQLTPVGEPFGVGADEVIDGKFTVHGAPGREVFWLVKAERFGGDFLLEEEIPQEAAA